MKKYDKQALTESGLAKHTKNSGMAHYVVEVSTAQAAGRWLSSAERKRLRREARAAKKGGGATA